MNFNYQIATVAIQYVSRSCIWIWPGHVSKSVVLIGELAVIHELQQLFAQAAYEVSEYIFWVNRRSEVIS